MTADKATYQVLYGQKDITRDILPCVKSLSYTDKSEGEADEIELSLEDVDGKWRSDWYPTKGDTISAKIFYKGFETNCGSFTIDEVVGRGGRSGSEFAIRGLAAGINSKVRTVKSKAHENKTLRQIAGSIAAEHGFTVVGEIADISIGRITQYRKTDLSFLKNIAKDYGYVFSVRDKQLVFTSIYKLEGIASVLTLKLKDLITWDISDKTSESYKDVKLDYHKPKDKKVVQYRAAESNAAYTTKTDTLVLNNRAENQQQAEMIAKAALYRHNSMHQEGQIQVEGNHLIVAGNNIRLDGLAMFSGLYYITESTHLVASYGGYTTDASIKRVKK